MSFDLFGRAWCDVALNPDQKVVLMVLAEHADHISHEVKMLPDELQSKAGIYLEKRLNKVMSQLMRQRLLIELGPNHYRVFP